MSARIHNHRVVDSARLQEQVARATLYPSRGRSVMAAVFIPSKAPELSGRRLGRVTTEDVTLHVRHE